MHQMLTQSQPQENRPREILLMSTHVESRGREVPEDLDLFEESMDIKYLGSSCSLDDQADWAVARSVLVALNPSEELPPAPQRRSQEEAGRYLREARIALFAYLPYTHPLSWRTRLDGTLVEVESESLASTLGQRTGICNRMPRTDSQNGGALDDAQKRQKNSNAVDESEANSRGRKSCQGKI